MGVINITPDSFYEGSRAATESSLVKLAGKMLEEGATFLDVGGYSSRPGATDISLEEELVRILPAVKAIHRHFSEAIISIDTFRSQVAHAAVNEGASLVNDISAGTLDDSMLQTVATLGVPYVLMHMKGTPATMNTLANYDNVVTEVNQFFAHRIAECTRVGIHDIILDPGFGFAKTREHNFQLLEDLSQFRTHGSLLLAGLSRKSMIWKTLDISPEQSLNGTTVLNTVALLKGADILRVHDVKEAVEAISLIEKLP